MIEHWLIAGGVIFTAAAIQGAVGFGFAVMVVPMLVYLKVPPELAVMLMLILVTPQNVVSFVHQFRAVHWQSLLPYVLWVLVVQLAGVWLLGELKQLSHEQIKTFFGVLILAVLALQLLCKVKPKKHLHPGWSITAFTGAGLMGGLAGMHGPLVVIWTMAHDWTPQRIRGSLVLCYLVWSPFLVITLWLKYPTSGLTVCKWVGSMLPVSLLGVWAGLVLSKHFGRPILRALAISLLIVVAMVAIFG